MVAAVAASPSGLTESRSPTTRSTSRPQDSAVSRPESAAIRWAPSGISPARPAGRGSPPVKITTVGMRVNDKIVLRAFRRVRPRLQVEVEALHPSMQPLQELPVPVDRVGSRQDPVVLFGIRDQASRDTLGDQ